MRNFLLYFASFLVVLMLQEFLLSAINLYSLLNIYLYIIIIVMLPMQLSTVNVLLCALGVGAVMDLFSGTSALITICLLAVAFFRRGILNLTVGRDVIMGGGAPFSRRIGDAVFFRYSFTMSLFFAIIYFTLEMMSFEGFFITSLRIIISSVATSFLIYIIQLPLRTKNG